MIQLLLAFQLAITPLKGFHHEGIRDSTDTHIVIHSDETVNSSTALRYLRQTRKSYHYYIDRRGVIYQLVDPKFIANHAGWSIYHGKMHWNEFAIGICFANNKQAYTNAQYHSGHRLVEMLKKRYPMIDAKHIVTHHDIAKFRGKSDPGRNFSMERILPKT